MTIDVDRRRSISGNINQGRTKKREKKREKKGENLESDVALPSLDPIRHRGFAKSPHTDFSGRRHFFSPHRVKKCLPTWRLGWLYSRPKQGETLAD
ncbi:hypothetical protein BHE74_00029678 [Ensete ventricosum]|nr:hypothetical protein GW17_00041702 [Ensete ventricosum]RWW63168.1 hypothetical protein BHE74_00029678 [Ensete ventricosum]RZS14511.1 hypothetical protein BHM03_00046205 [Ensete ventricosum]